MILCVGIGTATEITVQKGDSIQAAVDNASSEDVITIQPGNYTENVKIYTDGLTIRSASGNPDNTMIKAKTATDNAIFVQADNVRISGITAAAATAQSASGIRLSGCNNCVIEQNKLTVNGRGIYLVSSTECTVSGNTVINCGYYGILLESSKGNTISGNTVTNSERGIYLGSSDDNTVSGNTVTLNNNVGFYSCSLCDRNLIYNNYFNNTGISIKTGSGSRFNTTKTSGPNIVDGPYIGGNYWGKPDGTGFSDTAVDNDGDGISDSTYTLPSSSYVDYLPLVYPSSLPEPVPPVADFSGDVTSGEAPLTVKFTDKSTGDPTTWDWDFGDGNVSTDKNPVHIYTSAGTYTTTLTVSNEDGASSKEGTIIVTQASEPEPEPVPPVADFSSDVTSGEAPLDVSFTDKSTGTPTAWEWDFGDETTSTDQNPVHTYYSAGAYTVTLTASNANGGSSKTGSITALQPPELALPVADFGTNATQGLAPLAIQFTYLSQNVVSWSWDFDNNGQPDSTIQNPVYVYEVPGTYTVNLTVSNENGAVSKTLEIEVLKERSSGGSSHSSGGGGGGGSPEPARNVETKELSQVYITNGKAVEFDFAKNATCVVYVSFDAKKTAGKTTTIAEELKKKSVLVSELPSDEVYKSFNVWVGNGGYATSKNIENPVLCFKVEKSWMQNKSIDRASIALNRYEDKAWVQLPVNLSEEDEEFLYFTAKVPGFSSFAITGKAKSLSEEDATGTEPEQETRSAEGEDVKNMGEEVKQTSAQGEDTKAPGFGIIYGIACILAVFLYKRKEKS
ncbi:MAG: PGF-pre-PGF domain-containing protein [Methanosarcina sp.]|uniref:PGF-pre-PGF domain-containing protein n=1 Tax=Methanosarcina sp. TaxID=2213 RepID=UPI00260B1494|nr:PGF-pre-PGF domain-containing protein [Methanosarcina sp.]MDD3247888.1 PGF-pre-PGF domain-containing protein [Methanosarcina sp.]MDD4247943.1 PGF-pre-PGF domain-containing protein [Methanosarcina sp.]